MQHELRVGVMPMAATAPVCRALTDAGGEPTLLREVWARDRDLERVRDGDLDLAIILGPIDLRGIQVLEMRSVVRSLVVAPTHPLADRASVSVGDALEQPTFRRPMDVADRWRSFWLNDDEREGGEPRYANVRATSEWEAQLAIGGGAVAGIAPYGWGSGLGLRSIAINGMPHAPVLAIRATGPARSPIADRAWQRLRALHPRAQGQRRLTDAETEVATLVSRGLSNREIASQRMVSVRTVETQVSAALRTLGVSSRSRLADLLRDSPAALATYPPPRR